ncbi:MAG: hypothetical protein GF390_03100, partial [Candidatus Pacebacteria bacterium]|nr:hypothetical protein [Candidatus Paceibacterota bacterium]
MKKRLYTHWPVLILLLISVFLWLTNYSLGTSLVGWDNTVPELNFFLNLKRIAFSVWQEYRGVGTLDGMAHAANIVHWGYAYLLSLIFPTNM